jgi:hypothetical protein
MTLAATVKAEILVNPTLSFGGVEANWADTG